MALTRTEFNQQCLKLAKLSQLYETAWSITRKDGRPLPLDSIGQGLESEPDMELMLMRSVVKKDPNDQQLNNYVYTASYSESYEVPVMYFSASDQNGSHLPLDRLITSQFDDLAKTVNQVEHPLLFQPFYMIHPCRTRDFMECHVEATRENYLVSWLSTVGTLIDLQLDPRLGLSIKNRELAITEGQQES